MRRFITSEEINDLDDNKQLSFLINNLFTDVIKPEFIAVVSTEDIDIELDNTEDIADNKIRYEYSVTLFAEQYENKQLFDFTTYIETYYLFKDTILNNLKQKLKPTIDEDLLIKVGLSPQQFLIQTYNIKMTPFFRSYSNFSTNNVYGNAHIIIDFSIEDISELEPEGIQALKTKYNYLCDNYNTSSTKELKQWALSLNIVDNVEELSRNELCNIIKLYYQF